MICELCLIKCKDNAYKPYCSYRCFNLGIAKKDLEKLNNNIIYRKSGINLTDEEEFIEFLSRMETRFNLKSHHFNEIKHSTVRDLVVIYTGRYSRKQMMRLEHTRHSKPYLERAINE